MGWLAKVGQLLLKVTAVATGVVPLLQGVLPTRGADVVKTVSDDLTQIAGIVTLVEGAAQAMTTPAPGAEKLKMATPLVAQIVLQSDLLVGHKIKDSAKFQAGCASVASGVADILSSLEA